MAGRIYHKGTPIIAYLIILIGNELYLVAFKDQATLDKAEKALSENRYPYVRARRVDKDSFGVVNQTGEQFLSDIS